MLMHDPKQVSDHFGLVRKHIHLSPEAAARQSMLRDMMGMSPFVAED